MNDLRTKLDSLMRKRARNLETGHGWREGASLWPPASEEAIAELQRRIGFPVEGDYFDLLRISDGVTDFLPTVPLFGCHDWPEPRNIEEVLEWRYDHCGEPGAMIDLVAVEDLDCLFPIGGGGYRSSGAIFLADRRRLPVPGPIIDVSLDDMICFHSLSDYLDYELDPGSFIDAGRVIGLPRQLN
jgi:hypothetical protein